MMFVSTGLFVFSVIVALSSCAPNVYKISNEPRGLTLAGGVPAEEGQFPFMASLQFCFFTICEHSCGGAILNENWILTSASCLSDASRVIVGALVLNTDSADKQTLIIDRKYAHPDFDQSTNIGPNDIGLVKLSTPLTFNDNVKAANLPKQGDQINGTVDLAGYGMEFFPNTNRLKAVLGLELTSYDKCNDAILALIPDADVLLDEDSNLCTLDENSNNCDGDIGGPLSQNGTVVGTVTWYIDPCGTAGAPNVFTNVSNFIDWIEETIAAHS